MKLIQNIKHLIHPLDDEEKGLIILEISESATSSFDFLLLVVLSCSIASLGLMTNSPAVIIGAMLVAPLMSPVIGIGLASITGNIMLARRSVVALFSGASLAILLSCLMTLINANLPFLFFEELPDEVMSRTHPTPIDLLIALAGGLAAAYALTRPKISATLPGVAIATALMPPLCTVGIGLALLRWDVVSGALLLFITNAITIAFAGALIFFLRGFAPEMHFTKHQIPRSLIISAVTTLILLIPLTYFSVQFFQQAKENLQINEVVSKQVKQINADLVELKTNRSVKGLDMVITVRINSPLSYEKVVALQKSIVDKLDQSVTLKVNQVLAKQFDPLIPPTPTPTPTLSRTNNPGSSPTVTRFPTNSPTVTCTPTASPTFTPTPGLVIALNTTISQLQLYQKPGGPVIGQFRWHQILTLLYGRQEMGGLIWVEVMANDGKVGWIPEIYLKMITITPSQ